MHLPALYNHLDAMQWRYATKKFDPSKKLDKELIYALQEILRLTPSSMGMQLWRFVILNDKEITNKLAKLCIMTPGENQEHAIQSASHVIVFCRPRLFEPALVDQHIEHVAYVQNKNINELDNYAAFLHAWAEKPVAELESWMDSQVYLALGCLISACASSRLDTSIAESFKREEVDALLGLHEKHLSSIAICSVGLRSVEDSSAKRKKVRYPIEDLFLEL